jgi:hypothetical protein
MATSSLRLLEGELALEGERGRLGLGQGDVGAGDPLAALAGVGPRHVQVLWGVGVGVVWWWVGG